MSANKGKFLKSIFPNKGACGGCGKPKLSDVAEPVMMKPTIPIYAHNPTPRFSSPSSGDRNGGLSLDDEPFTSTTVSLQSDLETDPNSTRLPSPATARIADSVAIEKDSDDPYKDFRRSMLQMITEKKIYSKDGLRELLNRFLDLNSPCHHGVILEAFMEIWSEFIVGNIGKL